MIGVGYTGRFFFFMWGPVAKRMSHCMVPIIQA